MDARSVMATLAQGQIPSPRSWRWPALLTGIGTAGIIVVVAAASDRLPDGTRQVSGYWISALVVSTVATGLGLALLLAWGSERAWRLNPNDRQRRISELTVALDDAVRTVTAIKTEIEEGTALLAELERRAKVTEELAELRDPQVIAITEQLRAELRVEGRRGLIGTGIVGAIFFAFGVVVTLIAS